MLRVGLIFIFSAISTGIYCQESFEKRHRQNECEEYGGMIDSLYAYDWDEVSGQWNLVTIRHYFSSLGRYDRLLFLHNDRTPERAWDYYYDVSGNRDIEISSFYRDGIWYINFKKESDFDSENRKLSELRQNFKNDTWIFNSYQYYEYTGNRVDKVHYQLKDNAGNLYDRSYTVYHYDNYILTEVVGYDGGSGAVTGADRYLYDNKTGHVVEQITFGTSSDGSGTDLIPLKRRLFFYDELSLQREEIFQEMKNGSWETYHKYIIYYKLDNSKKVMICHNNQTICVSVNALSAHLAHGDKLGSCTNEDEDSRSTGRELKQNPCKIYPNPASDKIHVELDREADPDICRIDLVDSYGKIVRTYNTEHINEIEIPRGSLKSGRYFLRISGMEIYSVGVIFK